MKKVLTLILLWNIILLASRQKCGKTGCGSVWLEHLVWDQGVAGSNPVTPIFCDSYAGVVQWQNTSLPSQIRGFDSHHPLQNIEDVLILQSKTADGVSKAGVFTRLKNAENAFLNMCSQLSWIEQRPSKPWVGGSNPFEHIEDRLCLMGIGCLIWWVQRSWLARQIVALEAQGSNPCIHPGVNQETRFHIQQEERMWTFCCYE